MAALMIDKHLTEDKLKKWLTNYNSEIKVKVNQQRNTIFDEISKHQIQSEIILKGILNKTGEIHKKINYTNYLDWIKGNTPERLEDILKNKTECKCI